MGRATQIIDFLTINPLPAPYERQFIYTHIGHDEELKKIRKRLKKESK